MENKATLDYQTPRQPKQGAPASIGAFTCAVIAILITALAAVAGPAPRPLEGPAPPVITGAALLILLAWLLALIGGIVGLVAVILAFARAQYVTRPVLSLLTPIAAFVIAWCILKYRL